ncbi:MAG: DUF5053 domain-containing protein [Prevotella sp.]|jgi:alpha-N-acetylglucosamine transferase|nr:DUF5053 domain-containing protein [Prevotella sp.]
MTAKEQFLKFKSEWIRASVEERKQIEDAENDFFKSLSESEKAEVIESASSELSVLHKEADDLYVRKQLSGILPAISVSYIAKTYFNKTPMWFYQRLNGNLIKGKPAKFSSEDLKTINYALQDISKRIASIQLV